MNYRLLYDNPQESLITRILKVRHIDDDIERFLDPKLTDYWLDPFLLNDMDKAVDRIIQAMKSKEKIMIFGDYDVDGVTSSYILYRFLTKYLKYKNVSIMYPNRLTDGYGLKIHHLDQIKAKDISLVITVDNGITSIEEARYAQTLGIDIIITDHHKDLEELPEAVAVVNPQVSPNYPFKGLAGVGVSFKLINALLSKSTFDKEKKNEIFQYFLPIVAIGTVADIVPLIHENRMMVKRGLDLINTKKDEIPSSLKGFLKYLNLEEIDTFHIGFMIGPRINAGGRIDSPYDSLNTLLFSGEKQLKYLDIINQRNDERKKMQEEHFKLAEQLLNLDNQILIADHQEFHEGVVGIVSGKITEKYYKPSMVMRLDQEKGLGIASLRGPEYFNVIEMIQSAGDILERFGGHKQAGGLSVKLAHVDELKARFCAYCAERITQEHLKKTLAVDTKIFPEEREHPILSDIAKLAPFGEGNPEPLFLLENIHITKIENIGNKAKTHLKIHGLFGEKKITILVRGKGGSAQELNEHCDLQWNKEAKEHCTISVIGKIKKDTYKGGFFVDGTEIIRQ